MTNHKAIHIFNNLRPMTVGFDSVFTSFEALLDLTDNGSRVPNFPPYNIVKTGIADDVEVKGAELKDGLLKVSLEKIVPDSKKPRTIKIK